MHAMKNLAVVSLSLLAACSAPTGDPAGGAPPPSLGELGGHHFPITTQSADAQRLFDQGLAWCYGFHHDEAMRCFGAAAVADPQCAMAAWGLAYARGPHINNMAMTPEAAQRAHADAQTAKGLAANASAVEKALIEAITARYAWPAPEDRKELDLAYAKAMKPVYEAHGDHPDVAALYAEALMDLRPWDLWQQDGKPQLETPEILAVLERLLAAHPKHPQANHLYIHAVEASPQPERNLAAGERLANLAPAIGHLVHMPAHAFMRVGRYEDAAACNRRGIAADQKIIARTGRSGFYEVYRAHNYHFLCWCAMFLGRDEEAIAAARELVRELPPDVVKELAMFLEGFLTVPYHALIRFGRWDEVLAEPAPAAWQKSTRATHHYARGIAFAATGRTPEAQAEQKLFRAAVADVPEDWQLGVNKTRTVLAIGDAMLEGEILFRGGNKDTGLASLHKAVQLADVLRYDEPWGWMMPPRHALGALLLEADLIAVAEAVYRGDLERHPNNGWALHGLAECLRRQGNAADADAAVKRFDAAWQHATVRIQASCFCRRAE